MIHDIATSKPSYLPTYGRVARRSKFGAGTRRISTLQMILISACSSKGDGRKHAALFRFSPRLRREIGRRASLDAIRWFLARRVLPGSRTKVSTARAMMKEGAVEEKVDGLARATMPRRAAFGAR